MEYLGKIAEVHGFSKSMEAMKDIPIVEAALAYDNPSSGETVILVLNQALILVRT
jgi:predicted transcriptional regulator